jgi:hypothetical protein
VALPCALMNEIGAGAGPGSFRHRQRKGNGRARHFSSTRAKKFCRICRIVALQGRVSP